MGAEDANKYASAEQLRYARVLDVGMKLGLVMLVVSFLVYVSGLMPVHVPLEQLPQVWNLPVAEFLERTAAPTGWQWVPLVGTGDYLNFVGLAVLSGVTIVCYLAVIPDYRRQRDTAFLVICVLEVAVLVLAASGLLVVGH
ncbi:MAG TPA: hypothetical protein VLW45_13025 [Pelomicrobium sp.]|nr:hypothetical protein [Pelomicrobium sp.]